MVVKSPRVAAAQIVAQRKALQVLKQRYEKEIEKIEAQLARPLDVSLQVPKEVVRVEAPQVSVDAPSVQVTVPENAIAVHVQTETPTVNSPVQVTIPPEAIKVEVHVTADTPAVIPPLTPPAITFSPQMPEQALPPPRKTMYRVIRHQYTDQIEGIEAEDID